MTIRVVCKGCGSKLDAKDELRGQTRRCPKCGNPVHIEPTVRELTRPVKDETRDEPTLKAIRLHQNNLYVVLGSDREIAYWKANEGWFLNVGNGYQAVKRVPNRIPDVGNYVLVEGYVEQTEVGRRLKGLRFRTLQGRGILNALTRSETEIVERAGEPTSLSQSQKRFILQHIRQHYFFEFTSDSPEITDYLTGFDAHSHVIGQFVDS